MEQTERKSAKQFERYFKGVSNHWRIETLRMVVRRPGMTLEEISEALDSNIKTISEHTKKLVGAGLLNKKYQGRNVEHSVSPYGLKFIRFMQSF